MLEYIFLNIFFLIFVFSVKQYCEKHGVKHETLTDLKTACLGAQVLYVTRIQRERFESEEAYESVKVRAIIIEGATLLFF